MSKLRSVSTAFWSDPFIEELSPSEKLLFLYFITNEKTNMLGIYEVSIKKISYDTGLDIATINSALKIFEELGKLRYEFNHIILVNFMKHQNFNPNMKKSAIDVHNNLPNNLKINKLNIPKEDFLKGFESLLNHYGTVSKEEYKIEYESKKETESKKKNELNEIDFKSILIDHGFDETLLNEWFLIRSNKNATNSITYFKSFIKEVEDSKKPINDILKICVENSWAGFKNEWLENLNKNKNGKSTSKKSNVEYSDVLYQKINDGFQP